MLVAAKIEWKHPDAPWWRQDPAHFIYPVQTLVTLGLLDSLLEKLHLPLVVEMDAWSAVVFGAVGIGFWLLPTMLYDHWGLTGKTSGWLQSVRRRCAPRRF